MFSYKLLSDDCETIVATVQLFCGVRRLHKSQPRTQDTRANRTLTGPDTQRAEGEAHNHTQNSNPGERTPQTNLTFAHAHTPGSDARTKASGMMAGFPCPGAATKAAGETWGFLYDLVGFPIRYVSYCILMYLAVYLYVSRSYTSQDTPRYIKIHQDTT